MQQIIVSGVGGQGVLFITKLLAETAVGMGYPALISETHGMAQRGGNVISHLKIGEKAAGFASPLVRPGHADILLSLHPDALLVHGFYLKPQGQAFCNTHGHDTETNGARMPFPVSSIDATAIAAGLGSPISANLVLLGFALGSGRLFCRPEEVEDTLKSYGGRRLEASLAAFEAGVRLASTPGGLS